jgi:hypothetical protein
MKLTRRGRWVLGIVVVLVIAAIASGSKKSSSPTSSPSGSQTQTQSATSGTQSDARSYIKSLGTDADRVQASIQTVLIGVGEAQQSPTQANVNQLAQLAQQAHDSLAAFGRTLPIRRQRAVRLAMLR